MPITKGYFINKYPILLLFLSQKERVFVSGVVVALKTLFISLSLSLFTSFSVKIFVYLVYNLNK